MKKPAPPSKFIAKNKFAPDTIQWMEESSRWVCVIVAAIGSFAETGVGLLLFLAKI
jgi:hypothetical protein